jgi:pimeloyl-ACP methyl ester carboxylesterase
MNGRRVILLHGFNVRDDGDGTVGKLAPYFEGAGFRVKRPRYGWTFLLGVRYLNPRASRMIADLAEPGDIVVGHSNGCAIAVGAAEHGAPFSAMVLINPALDSDYRFPRQLERIHIWHSPSDAPVSWARFLPWHAWGDMGAVGYRGPFDPRVTSFNKENGYRISSHAHSDVFAPGKLEFFAPLIVSAIAPAHSNPNHCSS